MSAAASSIEEQKNETAATIPEEESEATISTKYSTKRVKGGGVTRKII